jgi:UDP-N-acetylglucosamine 2-epimerase
MTNEQQELVDQLRYRPVGTTAAQMREAATLIEQLAERYERLRAALTTYGAHRPSCPRSARPPGAATCICGLHDLLASKAETEVKL